MEESDLLKNRLQAITEKHRIQEDIRQRKLDLDREKLKLQHLKKKALREQWLLQDSASYNATDSSLQKSLLSDQRQTRALQIEMEVESLERAESMISTNAAFILNRLKAVEKSPRDIIKVPLLVTTGIPDVPESLSPPANKHSEANASRKNLFAMEINVTEKLLTGQSTRLSTASLPPDELNQHASLKVYDDGRKWVYALNSQEVWVEYGYGHQESIYRQQEERNNQSNLREGHRLGNHNRLRHPFGNQKDRHSSYQVRNCHGLQEDRPDYHHASSIIRSNSVVNVGRTNDCTPPKSHDQETESVYPAHPPSYPRHNGRPPTAMYSGPTHSERVPSPLYGDNNPYTIINAMEATEPITAIFMGFQMAQDDSGRGQEFEGSLKAELVIIEDNKDNIMKEKKCHVQLADNRYPTGSSANGKVGCVEGVGDRWTERRVGPGIRKIQKKHKPCCTVC
uniref:Palmdelphin n=1 Tax=Cyclopterus lumpus TaxID=8103 RepID=A0A8C3A8X7_CYCLU